MVMRTTLVLWNFLVSISLTSTLMRSVKNDTLSTLMMTCGHTSLIFLFSLIRLTMSLNNLEFNLIFMFLLP